MYTNHSKLFGIGRQIVVISSIIIIIVAAMVGLAWYYHNPTTTTTTSTTTSTQFSLIVTTRPLKPASVEEDTLGMLGMVGQRCIFLVSIKELSASGSKEPVQISAVNEEKMADVKVYPLKISTGEVTEVTVIPNAGSIDKNLTITITGERGGLIQKETAFVEVIDWEDTIGPTAADMRDRFIPWLAANYPQFNISSETMWEGTIVNPRILVVMHYIFLSEEWEIYVTWHVMTPPNDWTKIYLRHRFNETRSSYAFEISSVEGQDQPHAIEVPDWV